MPTCQKFNQPFLFWKAVGGVDGGSTVAVVGVSGLEVQVLVSGQQRGRDAGAVLPPPARTQPGPGLGPGAAAERGEGGHEQDEARQHRGSRSPSRTCFKT